MYLEVWAEDQYLAYIVDDKNNFRSTIAFIENDDRCKSAYIQKVKVNEATEALIARFNHLRSGQLTYEELVSELRLFLIAPEAYQYVVKGNTSTHMLRWCKLTESTVGLEPIRIKDK